MLDFLFDKHIFSIYQGIYRLEEDSIGKGIFFYNNYFSQSLIKIITF